MSLRSGRLHVSEQRDHLHHLHTQAITVGAKGCVDSSPPYSLKTRGSRRDGKAILLAAAAATVIQQENTRLGSKLASIYLRDGRQQTSHMFDPDLDRRRKHTAVCYDAKRAAALTRTFEENKYIASRLAAAPPSVGAIEAELRYDSVLAPRRLLRSRFKTKEDYAQYLAHRARTQSTLLRHKELKDAQQGGRTSLNWSEFESQLKLRAAEGHAQQQQQLRIMSSTETGSRSASVSPSRQYLQQQRRAQSAGAGEVRAIMPSDLFISKLTSDDAAAAAEPHSHRQPDTAADADGAEDPYGEESFHDYPDDHQPEEEAEAEEAKEQQQIHRPKQQQRSKQAQSRSPSRDRPSRSRSAGLVRLPNGQLSYAPARSQHPQGWDSIHATPMKSASPTRGTSAQQHQRSPPKSLAVMHASPSADSLHYAHHAPVGAPGSYSSSDLFYSGSLMSSESTAQLMRDGAQVERALAARKKQLAKSASAAALHDGSPAKYRPNTAVHYTRPHPRPSPSASSKARPLSAVHSFTGLHSHDLRGARSTASLADYFASQNPGSEASSSLQWEYGGGIAATLPGGDPEVARELQAILTAQRMAEAMIEKEQGRAPEPSKMSSPPQKQQKRQHPVRANPSPTRSSDTSLRPRSTAASSTAAAAAAARRGALKSSPSSSPANPKQSRAAHSAQVLAARGKVLEAARGGIPTISSALQYDEEHDSFVFPVAAASNANQQRRPPPPALLSTDESGDEDLDPEMAPPARPWSSPSSVPKLTIQQALARELEAVDDGVVPHAAAANPADVDDDFESDADSAHEGGEEKDRGKLDWQEAMEEVHAADPTPKPTPSKKQQPSRQQLQQQAAEDAAAWRLQQQQLHEEFERETQHAPPLLNHSATAGSLLLLDDAPAQPQPQRNPAMSRSAAMRSASAKSLRPASSSGPTPSAAAVDASLDPLPDDVRLSTSLSVRDLKMLLGQPVDRGHTAGGKAASFGATAPLAALQKTAHHKPARPASSHHSILRASPSPASAHASSASLQAYGHTRAATATATPSPTKSRVGWQD